MLQFLKKKITAAFVAVEPEVDVEIIHKEVDDLEDFCIKELTNILNTTAIPETTQVISKADKMAALGFSSLNETIKESEVQKKEIEKSKEVVKVSGTALTEMASYRVKYPLDKIVPMSEFQKVLAKYNLVYAPAGAYIKDVPEKNVLEMTNAKPVNLLDKAFPAGVLTEVTVYEHSAGQAGISPEFLRQQCRTLAKELYTYDCPSYRKNLSLENLDLSWNLRKEVERLAVDRGLLTEQELTCLSLTVEQVRRDHLFIAAPKSHFNLDGLTSLDGREYYKGEALKFINVKTKDPIAFYLLRGQHGQEYVRIISKWGTDDDQSYLDPIVQNEGLN